MKTRNILMFVLWPGVVVSFTLIVLVFLVICWPVVLFADLDDK